MCVEIHTAIDDVDGHLTLLYNGPQNITYSVIQIACLPRRRGHPRTTPRCCNSRSPTELGLTVGETVGDTVGELK